jgi:hypothetical protein
MQYEAELDAAFAQARETGDLTVLISPVFQVYSHCAGLDRCEHGRRDGIGRISVTGLDVGGHWY